MTSTASPSDSSGACTPSAWRSKQRPPESVIDVSFPVGEASLVSRLASSMQNSSPFRPRENARVRLFFVGGPISLSGGGEAGGNWIRQGVVRSGGGSGGRRYFCRQCSASTTLAGRVASFRNVTHRPQKDRTAFPARDRPVSGHPTGPGAVARQHRRECVGPPPRELSSPRRRAPRWRSRRPPRPVRNRMSPSPSGTGHRTPVTEPQRHSPRSATGGAGGRAAGEAMPLPRQRSVVGR